MKLKAVIVPLLLAAPLAATASEPVPQALVQVCESCHGPGGSKPIMPVYPVLAGQHQNYLAQALKDYRSGARSNALMMPQAANLSDAEIKGLAAYFSAQESPLYTPTLP